ncbi:uncharacterized protein LOC128268841 isoform X2 [Anopheles cruzii]|uniref:uncharacterized protein LOC128268841 isoform X2 n=1 Tax=Anopheles cruzii TaxID=68878 RepID=UPI0022EC5C66|nr:uncharacterized protein LOC128268841 isoform X2 [Anopheles cruzii]
MCEPSFSTNKREERETETSQANDSHTMRVEEDDLPSLEFIEDPYIPKLDPSCITPSLDDVTELDDTSLHDDEGLIDQEEQQWSDETELYLRSLTLDEILGIPSKHEDIEHASNVELQTVEAEFSPVMVCNTLNSDSKNRKLRSTVNGQQVDCETNSGTAERGVEKTFLTSKFLLSRVTNRRIQTLFNRRNIRDVRVTFIDFSKPYLARISSDNPTKLSDASPIGSISSAEIANEFSGLSTEEQTAQRDEWSQELSRVEEEITTLRTVLQSKMRHASELKRKLGITVWKEITDDVSQGIKNVKESNVYQSVETKVGEITTVVTNAPIYQKTESAIKTTAGKTTSVIGGIAGKMTQKLTEMKQSDSFRSFEERVGSAYENVRSKVSSRSSSVQSLSDLQNDERRSSVTTPTAIPEDKPIP